VTDREAEEVFLDRRILVSSDVKHSEAEERFQALGQSSKGRVLFVSFTIRKNKIKIISARDANRKEAKKHEKV